VRSLPRAQPATTPLKVLVIQAKGIIWVANLWEEK